MCRCPLPILSPESMRLARWQPRHRTSRLRGYVPVQGFNPTQAYSGIYRGAFVPLSFRVIALLRSHYRSFALFGYLLTRGGVCNELPSQPSSTLPALVGMVSAPTAVVECLSALEVENYTSGVGSHSAVILGVHALRAKPIRYVVLGKSNCRADFEVRYFAL